METSAQARNAWKHGFCASHFVALENAVQINIIRQELIEIHQPVLAEEFQLVNDLALARFKVFQNEQTLNHRAAEERRHAATLFAEQARADHLRLLAGWRDDPLTHLEPLQASPLGIAFLLSVWRDLAASINTMPCTASLAQACEAVMALGSHWQLQMIGSRGRSLMGLFLAVHPKAEIMSNDWVNQSRGINALSNFELAEQIYAIAPSAEKARAELRRMIDQEIAALLEKQMAADTRQNEAIALFTAKSCGLGLTDPARMNEARLFLRYQTTDQNRADKLERRLHQMRQSQTRNRRNHQSISFDDNISNNDISDDSEQQADLRMKELSERLQEVERKRERWLAQFMNQDTINDFIDMKLSGQAEPDTETKKKPDESQSPVRELIEMQSTGARLHRDLMLWKAKKAQAELKRQRVRKHGTQEKMDLPPPAKSA